MYLHNIFISGTLQSAAVNMIIISINQIWNGSVFISLIYRSLTTDTITAFTQTHEGVQKDLQMNLGP